MFVFVVSGGIVYPGTVVTGGCELIDVGSRPFVGAVNAFNL